MRLEIKAPNDDPFKIGIDGDIFVEILETAFDREQESWATIVVVSGSKRTRETTIYGASALQSLRLATAFLGKLYEPELMEN